MKKVKATITIEPCEYAVIAGEHPDTAKYEVFYNGKRINDVTVLIRDSRISKINKDYTGYSWKDIFRLFKKKK